MRSRPFASTSVVALTVFTLACGGQSEQKDSATATPTPAAQVPGGPLTPAAGGKVITVEMMTDEQGNNRFSPAEIEANPGDVLRYTLVTGVHNVHFVADSNKVAGVELPAAGALLQAPGQTFDVAVSWAPGRYYFQCDPHALLGMVGHVNVTGH
jgi:plastocyanin